MGQLQLFLETADHDEVLGMSNHCKSASTAVLRSLVQCSARGRLQMAGGSTQSKRDGESLVGEGREARDER